MKRFLAVGGMIMLALVHVEPVNAASEVPWGSWKGLVQIAFRGTCRAIPTGSPIDQFMVTPVIRGTEQEAQVVHAEDGVFHFELQTATLNGRTIIHDFRTHRVLGSRADELVLRITSAGYRGSDIVLTGDRILVGPENSLDITLERVTD